jgi:hypothetical protein
MTTPSNALTVQDQGQNQLATQPEVSIGGMLQAVIQQGVTETNVAALDKLCGLYERMQTRSAEQEFNRAFVELQNSLPPIETTRPVPAKDGTIKYKFAPYEEIMRAVKPCLKEHGFTISYNSDVEGARMVVTCTLTHTGGHSRSNRFGVRVGGGPPGANEMQADGAAKTYAKRGALCDALNIVIDHDTDGNDDARKLGAAISAEDAASLRTRIDRLGADESKFLAFAGVGSFEEIPATKLEALDKILRKKEAAL